MRKKLLVALLVILSIGAVVGSTQFVGACGKNGTAGPDPC